MTLTKLNWASRRRSPTPHGRLGERAGLALLGIFLLLLTAHGCGDAAIQSEADEIVGALEGGDHISVARSLYYPSSLQGDRLIEERRAVEAGLRFLLEEFGRPVIGALSADPPDFYEVGISAGELADWAPLTRDAETSSLVYSVEFEKLGPGLIAVAFINTQGSWVVQSVDFALNAETPHSRERIVEIGRRMVSRMTVAEPNEVDRAIQEVLPKGDGR